MTTPKISELQNRLQLGPVYLDLSILDLVYVVLAFFSCAFAHKE